MENDPSTMNPIQFVKYYFEVLKHVLKTEEVNDFLNGESFTISVVGKDKPYKEISSLAVLLAYRDGDFLMMEKELECFSNTELVTNIDQ